jgi:hypothetical protein
VSGGAGYGAMGGDPRRPIAVCCNSLVFAGILMVS